MNKFFWRVRMKRSLILSLGVFCLAGSAHAAVSGNWAGSVTVGDTSAGTSELCNDVKIAITSDNGNFQMNQDWSSCYAGYELSVAATIDGTNLVVDGAVVGSITEDAISFDGLRTVDGDAVVSAKAQVDATSGAISYSDTVTYEGSDLVESDAGVLDKVLPPAAL